MPTIIYRGKDVTVTAVAGDEVTFELTENSTEYRIDWTATADVWTHSPTTVLKQVSSNGTLYLSEGWLGRHSIGYAGDPKYPASLGGVGLASRPPFDWMTVPVEVAEVVPRIAVLGDDGCLSRSAPVTPDDVAGDLGPVGKRSTAALSGRWLHAHGLLSNVDDGLHERVVVHTGDEVMVRLLAGGRAEPVKVNLADRSRFAPLRSAEPDSPTDLVLVPGARGTLGVAPNWLYHNA